MMTMYKNTANFKQITQLVLQLMFEETKYQDNPYIGVLISNPLYRRLFCQSHGFIYQYRCINKDCPDSYICGKIECIDSHFHSNQLNIQKFNYLEIVKKIERLQRLATLPATVTPILSELKEIVDHMKERSNQIFKFFKDYKKSAQYLSKEVTSPFSFEYLDKIDECQQIQKVIERQINQISSRINWKNVWISLHDQLEMVQKLRINFNCFNNFYFQVTSLSQLQLKQKWEYLQNQKCEGLIILYFTQQFYVIGEYISNNNVQICSSFIPNFIFITDLNGQVHQHQTNIEIIKISDHSEADELKITLSNLYQFNSQIQDDLGSFKVKRIVSFKAYLNSQ